MIEDKQLKSKIVDELLHSCGEWFGIEESIQEYMSLAKNLPFFACEDEGKYVGFVVLKATSKYTAELCCMAVLPSYHKQGVGRSLFEAFEGYAKQNGFKFIQVKTVKEGCYECYDITNKFYKKMGFYELEVFPTFWDERNPCQIYVKAI